MILETVRQIVLAQLSDANADAELGFDDDLWGWGMTSITSVGIVIKVEDAFEIELPEEYLSRRTLSTVRFIGAAVADVSGASLEGVA